MFGPAGASPYNFSIMTYDDGDGTPDTMSLNAYGGITFCVGSNTRNQKMELNDSGDLKIEGTLTLNAGEQIYFDSTDTYIYASTDNPEHLHIGADASIYLDADNDVIFRAGSTEYARFDATYGSLVIGTSAGPSAAALLKLYRDGANTEFHVERGSGSAFRLQCQASVTTAGTTGATSYALITSGSQRMVIDANGLVGVGATPTAAEAEFQVDADATFNTYIVNKTDVAPTLTGGEVKNTLVVMNHSGSATPNIASGTAGESVTILNVDASNTVTVTAGPGITFLSTAAALTTGESEKWVCYKANNWVRVATET